ncbi:MAG: endonuclease III [Bacteroidales bacterium]|nr:endonuclease III [Bacteroidales bacterium]
MPIAERYRRILDYFRENVGEQSSELVFRNPYELLVSVILSAQCTDKRVNQVTPALFAAYPIVDALALATPEEVLPYIKSVSYPNNKARNLVAMARKVMRDFDGQIPSGLDDIMSLPGAGRKTANVVTAILSNNPVIAVDTHVFRVSHRLGLSKGKTPLAVENDLERHIKPADRPLAHHWLLLHGRYICTARAPKCAACPLKDWCAMQTAL